MKEFSLYTGGGGGVYGGLLMGWNCVGYVDILDYNQKIIKQRILDGIFEKAPIFGDIRTFISEGYAKAYEGMVDIVTGGFPCQGFSMSGDRRGESDSRNMWPETMEVVKQVNPPFVFFENVQGLLSSKVDGESDEHVYYFGKILQDLAENGYNVKWCCLGADDVGAPHQRKRLWILGALPDSDLSQLKRRSLPQRVQKEHSDIGVCSGWKIEPGVGRVSDGLAYRGNRLIATGNGQVPLSMAVAFCLLSELFVE